MIATPCLLSNEPLHGPATLNCAGAADDTLVEPSQLKFTTWRIVYGGTYSDA